MIAICRHGVTEANAAGLFLSRTDVELSEIGRAQSEALKPALARLSLERCVVSPMRRCTQTLQIAAPQLPFEIHEALREVDFGDWEGKTLEWVERNDPRGLATRREDPVHFRPPQGESFADVAARLRELVEELRRPGSTLVVAHRGTLAVLERLLRGLPLEARSVISLEPGELRVID